METINNPESIDIIRLPVNQEEHVFPPWYMKYTQSHILHSKCSVTGQEDDGCPDNSDACQFCSYSRTLKMPHLPDMVFPNNVLYLKHKNGAVLEFLALDALKKVSNEKIDLELACAEAWRESRSDNKEYLEEKLKPFDWTFTTDYMGTMSGFDIEDTDERIDLEKLKRRDKILFYVDLTLFEDELHDNGIASLSVKMRVMPGSFYILLQYFLRIDNVMIKLNDTRIYHELGKNYLIREYTSREAKFKDLPQSISLYVHPSEVAPHLPIVENCHHKLIIANAQNTPGVNLLSPTKVDEAKDGSEDVSSGIFKANASDKSAKNIEITDPEKL